MDFFEANLEAMICSLILKLKKQYILSKESSIKQEQEI